MAKKKIQKTNAIRLLDQKKITYAEQEFAYSEDHVDAVTVAHTLGEEEDEIFKTLVTVGNKTGPVVAVIPGNKELDLKRLAKVSGNKKIEMLPLKDLEATTGYIRGGCSPVGMKKLYPTYFDSSALDHDKIHVSAGRRGLQMSVNPKELGELVRAKFEDIIVK
ncbi:Cys-tRNA(Pro) deacylase [Vagococcus sp. PNs007]|uniref:Cys-tRNA(Pro)/Cys-tRNA(Cys) deacylase n=1 Tax=Vagococcus proximus TaxID=2991417 RepID=A0ABT5X390_9ENTE|nr:Cys-tRNA(Pro) deacylase [Vagococcus proximus]MDF0480433.1 Cys-tRNA(Pro) deacylase [Vagococcus proximus]